MMTDSTATGGMRPFDSGSLPRSQLTCRRGETGCDVSLTAATRRPLVEYLIPNEGSMGSNARQLHELAVGRS